MSRKLLRSAGLFASAELFSKLTNFGSFAALYGVEETIALIEQGLAGELA